MTYAEELRKEGRQEEKQQIARELLKSGVDKSIVARASHLTEQELEQIQNSLH